MELINWEERTTKINKLHCRVLNKTIRKMAVYIFLQAD